MPSISMRQLLEAGVHFGHQTRRWNPKMRPFIFAERNGIHIIDLAQTAKRLETALDFVRETVARGEVVLFVGTKKQAQEPLAAEATRAGMPYVNKRWLGGMLTNFVTIKKRIGLMDQLEAAGWRILGRHVRVGRAEIDILALDPGPPPTLVVVEVRWRGRRDFGLPEETVDRRKRDRLHAAGFALRAAGRLADGTPVPQAPLRFDLVVVEPGNRVRHHRHGG